MNRKIWLRLGIAVAVCIMLFGGYVAWMSGKVISVWKTSHGQKSDCAIVLGAAVWDGKPSTAMRERLDIAVKVYRDGLAGRLILSGGVGAGDNMSEAQVMKTYLLAKGVPNSAIILEEGSHSTMENLLNSKAIMEDYHYGSAVLVTHGFHALRARLMAESLGIDATVEPVQIRPIDLKYYVLRECAGITAFGIKHLL